MYQNNTTVDSFQHEITIERVTCPLHVLQMKEGIKEIKEGDTLKVKCTAYVAPELLASARQMGSEVSINNEKNEIFIVR